MDTQSNTTSAPISPTATILGLYEEWRRVRENDCADDEQAQANHAIYRQLQEGILSMVPSTAQEAAIQFVVDTDYGDSDFSDGFWAKALALANESLAPDQSAPADQDAQIAEIGAIDFVGQEFELKEAMPTQGEWSELYASCWMIISLLKDDKGTLASKMAQMERQSVSEAFLEGLDYAHAETERLHQMVDFTRDRVLIAAAAAIGMLETSEADA